MPDVNDAGGVRGVHHPAPRTPPPDSAKPGAAFNDIFLALAAQREAAQKTKLDAVREFVARASGEEVQTVAVARRFDAMSADEALYQADTATRHFWVMRSKAGLMTVYDQKGRTDIY